MSKNGKILLLIVSIAVALVFLGYLLCVAAWQGVFDSKEIKEIATYNSSDGEYSLVFEQIGDPAWPFGPADVRFTLKNSNGKIIKRVSEQIHDDGAGASEGHIKSISWNDNAVVIILQGSEMKDKEVSISYNKN